MYKIYLDEEDNFITKVAIFRDETPLHIKLYKFDINMLEDALFELGVDFEKGILKKDDSIYLICFKINVDPNYISIIFEQIELKTHTFLSEYFICPNGRSRKYFADKIVAIIALQLVFLLSENEYNKEEFNKFLTHIGEYEKRNPIDSTEKTEYELYRKFYITPLKFDKNGS